MHFLGISCMNSLTSIFQDYLHINLRNSQKKNIFEKFSVDCSWNTIRDKFSNSSRHSFKKILQGFLQNRLHPGISSEVLIFQGFLQKFVHVFLTKLLQLFLEKCLQTLHWKFPQKCFRKIVRDSSRKLCNNSFRASAEPYPGLSPLIFPEISQRLSLGIFPRIL